MQKRACFDFEIEFSNGGGIQGHGFRLDIPGDDIDDESLAAYVIRDMRLLMVGKAHILNKRIIQEPHKRSTSPAPREAGEANAPAFIDLSHSISSGMMTVKGLPAPMICDHLSRIASRSLYGAGTEFQIDRLEMVGNTGTYIDVPFHRYADGYDLAGLPLSHVADVPGITVKALGAADRAIDWHHFVPYECRGRAVLVHTGWDQHWGSERYFDGHPYLTEKAATYLRDQGAVMVGIDSLNIDDTAGTERPVHSVLLAAGIPIIEHMTRLGDLPTENFRLHAAPPKVVGMGTFPVRAHATLR